MSTAKTFVLIAGATAAGICVLCGSCVGVTAFYNARYEKARERNLARGFTKGLRPLRRNDQSGILVYQWNPDSPTIPPRRLGKFAGANVAHGDEITAAAQETNGKVSYFKLDDDQYEFWVNQD